MCGACLPEKEGAGYGRENRRGERTSMGERTGMGERIGMDEKINMGKSIDREMLRRMEREALEELLHYHEKSGKQKAKNMIRKMCGSYVPPEDLIFWPTGLIANVLAENLEAWENKEEVLAALRAYFDRWIGRGMPLYYVDDTLCGVALLILCEKTGEEKYRTGADRMAEYLFALETEEANGAGSIPYRPAQKNKHVYADGIGMMCPFLSRYGVAFGKEKAVKLALTQIENMLEYGMDEKTGLPYHGFQYENRTKYGIIGWGRAVGWLLMGMAGTLEALECRGKPDGMEDRDTICEGSRKIAGAFDNITDRLAAYQKENGAYCWQLQAKEGPEDSSATAMIAYALRKRAGAGTSSEKAAEYLASCEKNGKIYQCSGECMGFSQYPQVYGAYPWSLAPCLGVLDVSSVPDI